MIYFVQPVDGGPVKIGTATDVARRLSQLEAHYGAPLALLGTMEGGRAEEREIHARFSHLRFGRTEQFRPAPDLMEFIGLPLFVSAAGVSELIPEIERKPMAVQVRASQEWADWLQRGAAHCGLPLSSVVDQAVRLYFKSQGFDEPAPKR